MVVVNYWGHMLGINIETEMRRKSFDHLQKLSFRFYDNQKTGHLVARVTKDLEEIGEVAHHGPEDLFIAVMTFLGAFVLMTMVNPHLALVTPTTVIGTVADRRSPPRRKRNAEVRVREYLTDAEVTRLIAAAARNRYGHRDATMVLVAYRHGLRAA